MGESQEIMDILLRARTIGLDSIQKTRQAITGVMTAAQSAQQAIRRQGQAFIQATDASKRFRFELLSTMFAGMALKNAMFGLLQPALQTSGAFDVLTATLEILFLPIALFLLDNVFLPMMDFFTGLPEPVQGVIGALVLFLGLAGAAISIISQLGMLMSGGVMKSFLTFAGTLLGPIITAVTSFASTALAAIVGLGAGWLIAIGLILAGIILNWDGIVAAFNTGIAMITSLVTEGWDNLMGIITGFMDLIVGIIHGILTGDWSQAWDAGVQIVESAIGLIKNIVWDLPATMLTIGFEFAKAIAQGLINGYGLLKNAIKGIPILGPILDQLFTAGEGLVGSLATILGKILSKIPGFAEGGIVTGPTLAMVGEKGPEAIVPLTGGNMGVMGGNSIGQASIFIQTGPISSDIDMRRLAEVVNEGLYKDYRRHTFAR